MNLNIESNGSKIINRTVYYNAGFDYLEDQLNQTEKDNVMYSVNLVIPITVVYVIIFFTGLIGNVSTCIVILKNKSMHTATNYYLCSLAISDLLLLISGLPPEMYRIWSPENYVFGEIFCIMQGFAAETSANATVLTITAFTVERYLAICHPFLSHTMSKLSRVVKYVIAIWIAALCLAAPQAMQFGIEIQKGSDGLPKHRCTVVTKTFYFKHAFEISTFLFFIGPMTLITVLYVLIGVKLRKSRMLPLQHGDSVFKNVNGEVCTPRITRNATGQKRVIKMLVAVVAAFFICWAPFHAQRLLAVYLADASKEDQEMFLGLYTVLMHASGILYFVSTTVNPVLYHIMSKKFRDAFRTTFSQLCGSRETNLRETTRYSSLLRHPQSFRNCQTSNELQPNNLSIKGIGCENSTRLPKEHTSEETALSKPAQKRVFRSRIRSESSQATIATTISSTLSTEVRGDNRKIGKLITSHSQYFAHKLQPRTYLNNRKNNILNYRMFKIFTKPNLHPRCKFLKQDSSHSVGTISNSSLQDLGDGEFNSTELAEYLKQVNNEIS